MTKHIPGYNGFIPQAETNENAIQQSKAEAMRSAIIKQNVVENQSVRLPGYAGYKPVSVINDRGSLRPSCLNTEGETFN